MAGTADRPAIHADPAGELIVERSTTPWRVLESGPAESQAPEDAAPANRGARQLRMSPASWAIGGGILAAIATFVLASMLLGGSAGTTASFERVGGSSEPLASRKAPGMPATADQLVVEVTGAVRHPGLVRLPPGARIADAVEAAGGYAPDLDTRAANATLNLAARIEDGDRIHVPSRVDVETAGQPAGTGAGGSAPAGATEESSATSSAGPSVIDLNTATAAELDTLPGIGPATAAKILAARDEAPFTSVDDLRSRKLVTASTFTKIQPLVTVR